MDFISTGMTEVGVADLAQVPNQLRGSFQAAPGQQRVHQVLLGTLVGSFDTPVLLLILPMQQLLRTIKVRVGQAESRPSRWTADKDAALG